MRNVKPNLKCLIVDDESIAIKGIINNIRNFDFLNVVDTCSSALEASEILKNKTIDLMFLDINMPVLSGLDFLENLENPPLTIITTAYSEYALDGFRLHVVDYLMKPIALQRFFQAVTKAREVFLSQLILQNENEETLANNMYIRQGESFVKISAKDILYIEGMQNYVRIHLKTKIITIHQTMTSLEEILPQNYFFRIHRSYLINTLHIEQISGGIIRINNTNLPIAKARRDDLFQSIVYKGLISK